MYFEGVVFPLGAPLSLSLSLLLTNCEPCALPGAGKCVCMNPTKMEKKESTMSNKERKGSTQGKGRLYKKTQIPMLPPKSGRSGVTFHC